MAAWRVALRQLSPASQAQSRTPLGGADSAPESSHEPRREPEQPTPATDNATPRTPAAFISRQRLPHLPAFVDDAVARLVDLAVVRGDEARQPGELVEWVPRQAKLRVDVDEEAWGAGRELALEDLPRPGDDPAGGVGVDGIVRDRAAVRVPRQRVRADVAGGRVQIRFEVDARQLAPHEQLVSRRCVRADEPACVAALRARREPGGVQHEE